jgi:putative Holliday junction resolvase
MVIVALDVGDARIGVAACDELELLAAPLATIRRTTTAAALDALVAEIQRAGAELVVVGLPVSFDGQLHAQARAIQSFAEKLRRRLSVPLVFVDETLSSVRAEERLREAGVRGPRIRERIDAEAAAVILSDYLDQRRRAARRDTPPQTLPEGDVIHEEDERG